MAGLPAEIRKKLSEGSPLTPEESKQVAEYNAYLEEESKKAFKDRDEERQRRKALEDAEAERKKAEETEVDKLKREKAEADARAKSLEEEAKLGRELRAAKVEEAKKVLGEAWDESYARLSPVALDRLIAKLNEKKPGTPPPPGGGSEGPKDYEDYLRNGSQYIDWAAKNRAELERMKAAYDAKRRG